MTSEVIYMMPKTSYSISMNEWALWKDTRSLVENQVLLLKKKSYFVITLNEFSLSLTLSFPFLSLSLLTPSPLLSCLSRSFSWSVTQLSNKNLTIIFSMWTQHQALGIKQWIRQKTVLWLGSSQSKQVTHHQDNYNLAWEMLWQESVGHYKII